MGKFLNSQLLLSDLPAGNDGSHQNKYQVQDDEKNHHDSLQARLKGGIGDYIEWGGGGGGERSAGSHIKRSGNFGNFKSIPYKVPRSCFLGVAPICFQP